MTRCDATARNTTSRNTRFDTVVAGQRVRWYPTKGQRDLAHRCFGQARMVYNQALHQSEAAYRGGQKLSISQISQLWTQFKAAHPEHADIPSSSACNTVHDRDINAAVNVLDYARSNRLQDVEGDTHRRGLGALGEASTA